jgi:cyclase
VIPCLLLKGAGLVKTARFKDPVYLGDPRNVVKLFNDKEVDELCFLDIMASKEGRGPDFQLLREVADESFMPLGYGGGVRTVEDAQRIVGIGIEKVVINTAALRNPALVERCASALGSQSLVVSIDVRRRPFFGSYEVYSHANGKGAGEPPAAMARRMRDAGAGEILLNSVDLDGTMKGYDANLIGEVSRSVDVPVIACGGAGRIEDLACAVESGASASAAGSIFVFHGKLKAVLISFPSSAALGKLFSGRNGA